MGHTVKPDYYGTYSKNRIIMGHTVNRIIMGHTVKTGLFWDIQ